MKILVTAPTEQIGGRIVPELLAPEFSVSVIVRDPAGLPEGIRDQVEVVRGSTDEAATLRRALEGVDAMFWCIPSESRRERSIERHYERFACAAWQAIREVRTPRVVTVSTLGIETACNAGTISGLRAMEEILNESGAEIRHLRCGWLVENLFAQARSIREKGVFSYPIGGDVPIPMETAKEVADSALRWLVRRDWDGVEGIRVRGTENISFSHAAKVMERVLKRPVQYREASPNEYSCRLMATGTSTEYARGQVEMFASLVENAMPANSRMTEPTAKTLAAWTQSEMVQVIEWLDERSHNEAAYVCGF